MWSPGDDRKQGRAAEGLTMAPTLYSFLWDKLYWKVSRIWQQQTDWDIHSECRDLALATAPSSSSRHYHPELMPLLLYLLLYKLDWDYLPSILSNSVTFYARNILTVSPPPDPPPHPLHGLNTSGIWGLLK